MDRFLRLNLSGSGYSQPFEPTCFIAHRRNCVSIGPLISIYLSSVVSEITVISYFRLVLIFLNQIQLQAVDLPFPSDRLVNQTGTKWFSQSRISFTLASIPEFSLDMCSFLVFLFVLRAFSA
jgi:hypothetical protein